ncbi:MAG: hypothetical protein ABI397_00135 [Candidatus Saccharimonas sp.]
MKSLNKALESTIGRTLIYLSIFILGAALRELLYFIIQPPVYSYASNVFFICIVVAFILVGAIFASKKHARSRVTSAATMFILSVVALKLNHASIADAYILVFALAIAAIGAQPALHRKLADTEWAIRYSIFTVIASFVVVVTFIYVMRVFDIIASNATNF